MKYFSRIIKWKRMTHHSLQDKESISYKTWRNEEKLFQYKQFVIAGFIALILFGIMDLIFLPEPIKSIFINITFLGITPFFILSGLILIFDKSGRLCPFFIFITLLVTSLGCVKLVILVDNSDIGYIYPVLMLIVLISFFLSGLSYRLSILISITVFVSYIIATLIQFGFEKSFVSEIFFLSLCIFFSSAGGYSLEHSQKKRYLQSEQLKSLASRDSLTNLFNRRHFFEFAEIRWKQAVRENLRITIMIADVDFFKQYNDCYGHIQGDHCLVELSKIFESSVRRPFDLVARYGGEEFIFLWYDADAEYIEREIERIKENILLKKIEHKDSSISEYVTVSLGAAICIPGHDLSLNDQIQSADKCLYYAKENGRNKSVFIKTNIVDCKVTAD